MGSHEAERELAIALCERVGVGIDRDRAPSDGFQWDGSTIAVKGALATNIVHDLAHWLVAEERFRRLPDFALGPGPESDGALTRKAWEIARARRPGNNIDEEVLASFLGIAIEFHLGLDWRKTAREHNWQQWKKFDFIDTAPKLEAMGLIKDGMPACLRKQR